MITTLSEPESLNRYKYKPTPCIVAKLLELLSTQESKYLQDQLSDERTPHRDIALWLNDNGIKGSETVIGKHRRNICSCRKPTKKGSK